MLLEIANRPVGDGQPLFVIAELGLNHGGSLARALALVDAAAEAGASAIKLQTLASDKLVATDAPPPQHLSGRDAPRSLADFFRTFELDGAAHLAIVRRARERGLAVLSTPLYEEAIDLLESIGVDGYKIASGDLTYTRLLDRVARTGKPVVLSTGMSELEEVDAAVGHLLAAGVRGLALLHCVSSYPVPPGGDNLLAIRTLIETFALPVGLSDHGQQKLAAPLAVALGANLYERHLILSSEDDAIDRAVSATPAELAAIVADAESARLSLGDGRKTCLPSEHANRMPSRRSLRAARPLEPGHVITPEDITVLRPGDGLPPANWDELVGTVVGRRLALHEAFAAEDLRESQLRMCHVD